MLEREMFHHFPFVAESNVFESFKIPRVKPTETMQRIADELGWFWYIDYDKNIHLFSRDTNNAPISIDENSNNFNNLSIEFDTSRLINRQVVKRGNETSDETYSQVIE